MNFDTDRDLLAIFMGIVAIGLVLQIVGQRRSGKGAPSRVQMVLWVATGVLLAIFLVGWVTRL